MSSRKALCVVQDASHFLDAGSMGHVVDFSCNQ
jgi:hypothetical protein